MRLTFLGGADEVGASSTIIDIAGKRLLVDAGIRISPRTSRGIQNDQLPDLHPISESGGPDYILVTHAHTDHTGALPLVMEQYPHVPVLATRPTEVLTRILQADAHRIMQSKQEQEGELPIFDEVASQRLMDAFQLVEFNQPVRLGEGLQVTFYPAGHIAGAAMLALESEEGTLVMSGDVSMSSQRAVVSGKVPRIRADALVLESTYGGKLHANRAAEEKRLIQSLKAVMERDGVALIPAFALGRAQEVLQIILAYRDELDVPVYVDGMVRAVCQGYQTFSDLLPENTVRAARDESLFFRNKIYRVTSASMREEVARGGGPAVIVASSGMLTGGASVAYAKHIAPEPRNAIFLTGYQDEEAPGRYLQRIMKAHEEEGEATLKLDAQNSVKVRCELGTYSLSAHADEMELVNMAEALQPESIMLVHGDGGARHSLATALRQRQHQVITPGIGTQREFAFGKRPWAIGQVQSGHETGKLDPAALWEALKSQAGSFFEARELAQMWWGDSSRAREAAATLQDSAYFSVDWRRKDTFQVRKPKQVQRVLRQREIMMAHPDIVGKLVVLRDVHERPRFGVVTDAGIDWFDADVANTKGRHFPGDSLLWVLGDWQGYGEAKGRKAQIKELVKKARSFTDHVLNFSKRQALAEAGQPVKPEDLLPDPLPYGLTRLEALVAVVLALAKDGASLENGGLVPRRARSGEPMEQNQARETAFTLIPDEARLRKVGMEQQRKRLVLNFDFPDVAKQRYADAIDALEEQSGWDVMVKPGVSQQALGTAVEELLPEGGRVVKGPSYYINSREVVVEVEGVEDVESLQQDFSQMTGFKLIVPSGSENGPTVPQPEQPENTEQMEINAAYDLIRDALGDYGLHKVGLKQGTIVLTFISPQVGERYREAIARLAEQTGYPITVHPHPNQQQILQVAGQIVREAGWHLRKNPGIHTDRGVVSLKLAESPDETTFQQFNARFEERTGYSFELS